MLCERMEKEKSVGKHFIRVKLIFFFFKEWGHCNCREGFGQKAGEEEEINQSFGKEVSNKKKIRREGNGSRGK